MIGLNLIPFFMIGLLGSVHCIGMCGGIVSALSVSPTGKEPIRFSNNTILTRTFSYNLGRIGSYTIAGTIVGGLTAKANTLINIAVWQNATYVVINVVLIALGLYLMDAWRGLHFFEKLGQHCWNKIKPLTRFLVPCDTPFKLLLMGVVWGWIPCGMVYSVLFTAMLSGSTWHGASIMLAFGLGTLPMLLAIGVFGAQCRQFLQHRSVRLTSGVIVLSFGVIGLIRLVVGLPAHWLNAFCVGTM